MSPAAWSEVTARVVIEAASAHPDDVIIEVGTGDGVIAKALAPKVRRVIAFDQLDQVERPLPPNVTVQVGSLDCPPCALASVVVMNDVLSRLDPGRQQAMIQYLGRSLPHRALLVIGDVMWSVPPKDIDEPEQYGVNVTNARTVREVEDDLRTAGFLPDTHRFGVGRAVLICLKSTTP